MDWSTSFVATDGPMRFVKKWAVLVGNGSFLVFFGPVCHLGPLESR
jgi:hypothetical protein